MAECSAAPHEPHPHPFAPAEVQKAFSEFVKKIQSSGSGSGSFDLLFDMRLLLTCNSFQIVILCELARCLQGVLGDAFAVLAAEYS